MIYDGHNFTGELHVEQIRRPLIAEVSNELMELPGADGAIHRNMRLSSKTIEVDVRLIAPIAGRKNQNLKLEDIRRKLGTNLVRRTPCKLVLDDAPDLYDMAVLDGSTDLERLAYTKSATLSWVCPHPASFGKWHYKSSEGPGELNIRVAGNYPASPLISVISEGAFNLTIDGIPFELTQEAIGEVIIDAETHTVTVNDEPAAYSIYSDFPLWAYGQHTVVCDSPFAVGYRERWL